jgi:ketosteroid isomerase-like protein
MRRLVTFLLLLPVLAACQPAAPPVDLVAEEEAILAQVVAFNAGVKAYDESVIAATYTPDAVLLAPNQGRMTGADELTAYFSGMEQVGIQMTVTPLDIVIAASGDIAVDVGTWALTIPTPEGGTFSDNGKYVAMWKKTNGTWLMHYDIWNSDNAPPPPAK